MQIQQQEFCQVDDHNNQEIIAVCTFQTCQEENRKCCQKCLLKLHINHRENLRDLQDLKQIYSEIQSQFPKLINEQNCKITQLSNQLIEIITNIQINFYTFESQLILENHHKIQREIEQTYNMIIKSLELQIEQLQSYAKDQYSLDEAMKFNSIGNKQVKLKKYKEAIEKYDKAIQLYPGNATFWSNKGNTLNSLQRFTEALICLDTALQYRPNYAIALREKAYALHNMKNYQEAITLLEQAILLKPNDGYNWQYKGNCLYKLKNYNEAVEAYEKSLQCEKRAGRYYKLGNTYKKMGNIEQAIKQYNLALARDKTFGKAKKQLMKIEIQQE